jgi:DNA-binding NtrC family response regulator
MAVDCGALPEGLLEAELFGHVRGAFTGADRDRVGLIQEADGGTLFLDEITNTSLALQARLLRVLQEREVRRVGENTPRRVDVRVIAASNADVPRLVAEGGFRQDLYYRLNVVTIRVPPLRDRREDIPLLIEHLAARCVAKGLAPRAFAPEVHAALARHHWPGNVRELENLVERLMVMAPGPVVTIADLPHEYRGAGPDPAGRRPSSTGPRDAQVDPRTGEQVMIEQALERFGGDKAKAARYIGWNRQKLYRRMKHLSVAANHGQAGSGSDEATPPKRLRRAV